MSRAERAFAVLIEMPHHNFFLHAHIPKGRFENRSGPFGQILLHFSGLAGCQRLIISALIWGKRYTLQWLATLVVVTAVTRTLGKNAPVHNLSVYVRNSNLATNMFVRTNCGAVDPQMWAFYVRQLLFSSTVRLNDTLN